jgi:cytochrome b subunit of formate dehydrogenase
MNEIFRRRKTLLVYKSVQVELFKFVFWSNLLTAFVILSTGWLFIRTLQKFSTEIDDLAYLKEVVNAVSGYSWIYFIYVITGLVLMMSLVFYTWLKSSNTIAGPLFNIKKNLEDYVQNGNFRPIKLRDNDKLLELAEIINAAISRAESEKK